MKGYPSRSSMAWRVSDNAALWIDGQTDLDEIIRESARQFEGQVYHQQQAINHINTKTVKGKIYFYMWNMETQKHDYKGREDPTPAYRVRIKEIQAQAKARELELRSGVITKINSHYIIDLSKIKFKRKARHEIIRLSRLIKLSKKTRGIRRPDG